MTTTLQDLKDVGAFVVDELVPTDIEFTLDGGEPRKYTIHVRRLSIGVNEEIFLAGGDGNKSRTAKLISEAVRLGEGGKELISFKDAYTLHPSVAEAMVRAIGKVNGRVRKN